MISFSALPRPASQGAEGAPAKGKSGKEATPPKKAPKGAKAAKPAKAEAGAPREGSKTAQVVAMLQRKNGATISEILPWRAFLLLGKSGPTRQVAALRANVGQLWRKGGLP